MKTPICDFVRGYAEKNCVRLHMPGHKGCGTMGERYDITEITGADSLYEASGIIKESEENAGALFGAETFYSTEGSSLCIRAMLYLAVLYAKQSGKRPSVAAARNVHKAFVSAAALLDFDVRWIYSENNASYLSCKLSAKEIEAFLTKESELPTAVYLTSPDYLGNTADISGIAEVCRRHGVLLLVDNAHGAYLRFLPQSRHPIDLGADACCDSAHKTLPVLTGGAYLHVSHSAPEVFSTQAKTALSTFGSTSPSYLILQSLDAANKYLAEGYCKRVSEFVLKVNETKAELISQGYSFVGDEPLKLTLDAKAYGYSGTELGKRLTAQNVVPEFCDNDFTVFMITPETGETGLLKLKEALLAIPKKSAVKDTPPEFYKKERVLTIREAAFSNSETVPAADSLGRVLATVTVGCPPAVPIVVCGEKIDEAAVKCFEYYGILSCTVVK